MAGTRRYTVYSASQEYRATCKYPEDAAVLVASLGNGATIRYGYAHIVWIEGYEPFSASESYDRVSCVIQERVDQKIREHALRPFV